jgi:hypothetical protein
VSVRGSLVDLLLVIHRRQGVRTDGIEIAGDEALLDRYLDHVDFG